MTGGPSEETDVLVVGGGIAYGAPPCLEGAVAAGTEAADRVHAWLTAGP